MPVTEKNSNAMLKHEKTAPVTRTISSGIEIPEAEPHGTLPYGAERLMHQRRAVGTRTGGDPIAREQLIRDPCRIQISDIQRNNGTAVPGREIPIDADAGNPYCFFIKLPA